MSLPDGFLARHKCGNIFIETGTGTGGGIHSAFAAGFLKVFSADLDPEMVATARNLTAGFNAQIFLEESPIFLEMILPRIKQPVTIFLDAHTRGRESPLGLELYQIFGFNHKHTVIIDDCHRYRDGTYLPNFGIMTERLLMAGYKLTLHGNRVANNNLLVAKSWDE